MLRIIIKTTVLVFGAKAIGLLLPLAVAFYIGANSETDAFFYAYTIVLMATIVISPVSEQVFIPYLLVGKECLPCIFFWMVLVTSFLYVVVALVIYAALIFVLPSISGFSDLELSIIQRFVLVILPFGLFLLVASVFSALLNAFEHFDVTAVSTAIRAFTAVLSLLLFFEYVGVMSVALGLVAGEALRLCFLAVAAWRRDIRFLARSSCRNVDGRFGFVRPMIVQLGGAAFVALIPFINKTVVSWGEEGSISVVEYAEKFYLIAVTVMTAGLLPVMLSKWSRQHNLEAENKIMLLGQAKTVAFRSAMVSLVVAAAVYWAYAHGTGLLFASLKQEVIDELGVTLLGFLVGLPAYVYASILVRLLFATRMGGVVAILSVLNVAATLALDIVFFDAFGVSGVSYANSLVAYVMCALLLISTHRSCSRV